MLGDRLKSLRKANKFTQKDVADLLGLDRTSYTYYETNKTSPSLKNLYKLSRIYHVSVDYILKGEDSEYEANSNMPFEAVSDVDSFMKLSKEERILLSYFRIINESSQYKVLDFAEGLANTDFADPLQEYPSVKGRKAAIEEE